MTMTKEEALKYINNMWMTQETHDALEVLIPEFGMSDDERIRKTLIEFLTDIQKISESGRTTWAVREDDAEMCKSSIAYLERHKECLADSSKTSTDEDERIRKAIIDGMKFLQKQGKTLFYNVPMNDVIAYLENLKPSFRQIHDSVMWDSGLRTGIELGKKEQKPGKDEEIRKEIIGYLNSKVATAEETELLYFKRWIAYLESRNRS